MTAQLEESREISTEEVILAIMATHPKDTAFRRVQFEKKLNRAAIDINDPWLTDTLRPHMNGYCKGFNDSLSTLLMWGGLTYGTDDKYRLSQSGHAHGREVIDRMVPEQRTLCERVGAIILEKYTSTK